MDIRQLSALVAVAEHGSFSAAARALHTVQSNISTHVARLEKELGATLVDRSGGELTEEGRAVVDRARRIQHELDALISDVSSLHDDVKGQVRAGIIGTTARWLAPRLLEAMRDKHPNVRVIIVDASTTSLIPQLLTGQLDLAVANLPVIDPDLTVERLFDEDIVVTAPSWHPLSKRTRVGLEELAKHELILEPKGTAFRDDIDEDVAAAGVELVAQAELDGMRLVASLAFEGFGAAVVPATAAPAWLGGDFKVVPIDGLRRRQVGIARRRRGLPSAPARALNSVLIEVVSQQMAEYSSLHVPDE